MSKKEKEDRKKKFCVCGSKSKGKLPPRSYSIQFYRQWKSIIVRGELMRRREDEQNKRKSEKNISLRVWFKIERKTGTTIIFHSIPREMEIYICERRVDEKTGG